MKKVFLTAIIAAAFAFGMAACNGNKNAEEAADTVDSTECCEQAHECCEHQCTCADTTCAQNHCEGCQDTACCNPAEKHECCGNHEGCKNHDGQCCKEKNGQCCKNKENK